MCELVMVRSVWVCHGLMCARRVDHDFVCMSLLGFKPTLNLTLRICNKKCKFCVCMCVCERTCVHARGKIISNNNVQNRYLKQPKGVFSSTFVLKNMGFSSFIVIVGLISMLNVSLCCIWWFGWLLVVGPTCQFHMSYIRRAYKITPLGWLGWI